MSEFRKRLIHIHSCSSVSRNMIRAILNIDPQLLKIYDSSVALLQTHFRLSTKKAQTIHTYLKGSSPDQYLNYLQAKNIFVYTILDSEYPAILKQIYDPPLVLYGMGAKDIIFSEKRLAVIGTRTPTSIGSKTVSAIIPPLSEQGWTIVSGFARGIDSLAHWQALHSTGKTIAVLGSGHSYIYPKENFQLFSQMSKKQLIVSEYPPNTPPQKWHFPARNRIISGISKAVLVIEAKEKSGSLITADQALEQGRDVFAIPGSIFSPQSQGTNFLIQQGAKLVMNANDILQELQ
ncbi:DNA-processing protein DprA [Halalkalibacter alkaliphilus]|uniref:DNA-processing protein DprA n=1 Tax=Halalkalibacter alkaliphilus TaxID=2917993 RepID=A0A9X1ZVT8_9BACI|nr:DNA-processing protein DprA [Halalkalibacter alkaliphilus]MCL7746454.1 DNA-processing protein DprA [Halalkalibacter alkaliphilus]